MIRNRQNKNVIKNEKGQALVLVVATLTVAMAVAVGVSLRNLSSISRTSRSDTAARAQAAAEGGAENFLARSDSELESLVGEPPETIEFTPQTGDNIVLEAIVSVENYNGEGDVYTASIKGGQVTEVRVNSGSTSRVCWKAADPNYLADLHILTYGSAGNYAKSLVVSDSPGAHTGAIDYPSTSYSTGPVASVSANALAEGEYDTCHDVSVAADENRMRIRAVNTDVEVSVRDLIAKIPYQGFKITSIGKLQDFAEGDEAESKVTVIRTYSYLPGLFDFGLYSGAENGLQAQIN